MIPDSKKPKIVGQNIRGIAEAIWHFQLIRFLYYTALSAKWGLALDIEKKLKILF